MKYKLLILLCCSTLSIKAQRQFTVAKEHGFKITISFDENYFYVTESKKVKDSFKEAYSFWFDSNRVEIKPVDSAYKYQGSVMVYKYKLDEDAITYFKGYTFEFSLSKWFEDYRVGKQKKWTPSFKVMKSIQYQVAMVTQYR